jgi:hypothetical protein
MNFAGFVPALTGTLGIGGLWDSKTQGLYFRYLKRVLRKTPAAAFKDSSKDGIRILPEIKAEGADTPVVLQVDLRALNADDPNYLAERLRALPKGSVVIAYGKQNQDESKDILSTLIKRIPSGNIFYIRKTYINKIKLEEVREELARRTAEFGIAPEHAVFLFSNLNGLDAAGRDLKKGLKGLGLVFQFDPERIEPRHRKIEGLSAAVLGEIAQYAALDERTRKLLLQQSSLEGLFKFQGGVYSLLASWIDTRLTKERVASSA